MTSDHDTMRPLGEIISGLFSGGHLPFSREDCRIWSVWRDVVGPAISKAATPSWIREGRLRVCVSDPIWLQELRFLESDIREKLNTHLGQDRVQKIEFRLERGKRHPPDRPAGARSQAPFAPRGRPRSGPVWPGTEDSDI
jgi:predicted nucleic acid-binding Zn ribbon protein